MSSVPNAPLIVHVIHRLDVGGLESGLINLINNLPADRYRHAIVCLTESSALKQRINRKDIYVYELHKRDVKDVAIYFRLWKLLRQMRPSIVHTRNLSALESCVIAAVAGVPICIHDEHGRDIYDLHGKNKKYQRLRRICSPFIHHFIALSQDLENWLHEEVGISSSKMAQIYNGVDAERFHPAEQNGTQYQGMPVRFTNGDSIVIGSVGRLEPVKDQITLNQAFLQLLKAEPSRRTLLRLVLIGDGSLWPKIEEMLTEIDAKELVWLDRVMMFRRFCVNWTFLSFPHLVRVLPTPFLRPWRAA